MDKKIKITLIIFLIVVFVVGIIDATQYQRSQYNDKLPDIITSQNWEADDDGDTQTISFRKDGSFGYSCSCGNPIDNYDLCDTYKYDAKTQTIKLKCSPGAGVTKIKLISATETELILDFDGEKREFKTEYYHIVENPLPFAGTKFESINGDRIVIKFTKYGIFESYNDTKGGLTLGSEVCFFWKYDKEKDEITLDCQDHTRKIKITKYPQNQGEAVPQELELYFEHEDKTYYFVKVKDNQ